MPKNVHPHLREFCKSVKNLQTSYRQMNRVGIGGKFNCGAGFINRVDDVNLPLVKRFESFRVSLPWPIHIINLVVVDKQNKTQQR